jgi:hypothetical protein
MAQKVDIGVGGGSWRLFWGIAAAAQFWGIF